MNTSTLIAATTILSVVVFVLVTLLLAIIVISNRDCSSSSTDTKGLTYDSREIDQPSRPNSKFPTLSSGFGSVRRWQMPRDVADLEAKRDRFSYSHTPPPMLRQDTAGDDRQDICTRQPIGLPQPARQNWKGTRHFRSGSWYLEPQSLECGDSGSRGSRSTDDLSLRGVYVVHDPPVCRLGGRGYTAHQIAEMDSKERQCRAFGPDNGK